jgi:hypothetical protein
MQIRAAIIEDAAEACEVLRRSIAELCRADHQDDPEVLRKWLSNKTPDHVRSWIARPDSYVVVASEGAAIVGVGAVTAAGEILLNYVSPDARFRGVSKAVLSCLEAKARELGNGACASPALRLPAASICPQDTSSRARPPGASARRRAIGCRSGSSRPRTQSSAVAKDR